MNQLAIQPTSTSPPRSSVPLLIAMRQSSDVEQDVISSEEFGIAHSVAPDAVVLAIGGDVDAATQPELQEALLGWLAVSAQTFVLDLRAVDFLGVAGLEMLNHVQHCAQTVGIALRLVAASKDILRPLKIAGLDATLACYPTVSAALGHDQSVTPVPLDRAQ